MSILRLGTLKRHSEDMFFPIKPTLFFSHQTNLGFLPSNQPWFNDADGWGFGAQPSCIQTVIIYLSHQDWHHQSLQTVSQVSTMMSYLSNKYSAACKSRLQVCQSGFGFACAVVSPQFWRSQAVRPNDEHDKEALAVYHSLVVLSYVALIFRGNSSCSSGNFPKHQPSHIIFVRSCGPC